MRTSRALAVAAAVALVATGAAAPGSAAPQPAKPPKILAKGLISPLRAAIAHDGTAYVTENFAGKLVKIVPGKKPRVVYQDKSGAEVGAVSFHKGVVTFAVAASDPQTGAYTATSLKQISKKGKVSTVADLLGYEQEHNPDGDVTYGVSDLSEDCAAQWPTDQAGPPSYTGIIDSHPYATYATARTTFVADAAMNAVLAVSRAGHVRTVAVLPPTPLVITQEFADAMGVPACAVGHTYNFESVPTDVERGRDGKLYVTTLGGAAGEQVPVGIVYRIDRATHEATPVVTGLSAPVGIAVTPNGDLYVSQLFGGQISRVKHGTAKARTFASMPMPGEVETRNGKVYATVDILSGLEEGRPTAQLRPGAQLRPAAQAKAGPNGKLVMFR